MLLKFPHVSPALSAHVSFRGCQPCTLRAPAWQTSFIGTHAKSPTASFRDLKVHWRADFFSTRRCKDGGVRCSVWAAGKAHHAMCWAAPAGMCSGHQGTQRLQSDATSCIGMHTCPDELPHQHAPQVPPRKI
eukprot:1161049-Pelagomonas_calceolata.AAC.15